MFVYLGLVLSQDLVVDVEEHPDPEKELVVVPVQVFPVALVQEHLRVVLLSPRPGGRVGDGAAARGLGLLPLPAPGYGGREAGVTLANLGPAELLGGDQVPDEGLDVLVAVVPLEAVHQAESHGVLRQRELENIKTETRLVSLIVRLGQDIENLLNSVRTTSGWCSFSISMALSSFYHIYKVDSINN